MISNGERLAPVLRFLSYSLSAAIGCSYSSVASTESDSGSTLAAAATWAYSGGNKEGTRYSSLAEINVGNVNKMQLAWTVRSGENTLLPLEHYRRANMQSTPILLPESAGGHLVICSSHNYMLALDPVTAEERWRFDPKVPLVKRTIGYKCRGNAFYWQNIRAAEDAPCRHRLYLGTLDRRIFSLDARTGQRCENFANAGELDIQAADDWTAADKQGQTFSQVFNTSQPVVAGDSLIIGSSIADLAYKNPPLGTINAYDARTGQAKWVFPIVPTAYASPASNTWSLDPTTHSGAANAWAPLSVDEPNNLVFVPTSSPSPDFYGGDRLGDNLYGNSLLALDTNTGELVWHFQFVHHDLWDYDTPAQPILFEWRNGATTVPAVLQVTKQGMVFAFNRLTGEPLIPIEERRVPERSDMPGEQVSPTQPFSTMPPLIRHRVTADDVWGLTPIDKWSCSKKLKEIDNRGIYTPPGYNRPSMHFPSEAGGANWGGATLTPDNLLVVNMMDLAQTLQLRKTAELENGPSDKNSPEDYAGGGYVPIRGSEFAFEKRPWFSMLGLPCVSPPWNKVVAVNLTTGEKRWEVPLGSIHDLAPLPIPFAINGFGAPGIGSGVVTAGNLFVIGATSDRMLRAFSTIDGTELWSHRLPADAMSGVATYRANGKQFFVTTAGGHEFLGRESGDYIIAFALPD